MSRKRYISTDMSKSGKLEELARRVGDYGVLLFTWMIPHFDDWGRMEGEPDKVFFEVTPRFAMLGKTPQDAETALGAMHDIGLITWYEVDGKRYVQANLDTFYELQTYIPKAKRAEDKSHYPPPPGNGVAQNSTESREVAQSSTHSREVAQNTPSPFTLLPYKDDDDDARAREGVDQRPPAVPVSDDTEDLEWRDLATAVFGVTFDAYAAAALDQDIADTSIEVVKEAMRRTVAQARQNRRSYYRRIINGWRGKARTLDDVRRLDEAAKPPTRASPPRLSALELAEMARLSRGGQAV